MVSKSSLLIITLWIAMPFSAAREPHPPTATSCQCPEATSEEFVCDTDGNYYTSMCFFQCALNWDTELKIGDNIC